MVGDAVVDLLVDQEAEMKWRPNLVTPCEPLTGRGIDPTSRGTYKTEARPRRRLGYETGEEIAAALEINQIRLPPPEPARLSSRFPCPGDGQLQGQDLVKMVWGKTIGHLGPRWSISTTWPPLAGRWVFSKNAPPSRALAMRSTRSSICSAKGKSRALRWGLRVSRTVLSMVFQDDRWV